MLSHFFRTQASFPVKDDWILQATQDLEDFKINNNFEWIKSQSKNKFRRLVKKQAREYALNLFSNMKSKHSKLDSLFYKDLKIQNHLISKENTVNQSQVLMKYRSRMAKYANNYEQTEGILDCKLCGNHPDLQEDFYECVFNKENVMLKGSYSDIFQAKINIDTIQTLEKIYRLRENKLENSQVHSV